MYDENNLNKCFNETFNGFISLQRENRNKDRNITLICVFALLLQSMLFVGTILYFANNFDIQIEQTTETTTTQTIEGENAEINNIEGNVYQGNSTHNENLK